jgi:hypothetical protein
MTSKLTLSVRTSTIAKAKKYARRHGTSVSKIFEDHISSITSITSSENKESEDPLQSLRRLKGIARNLSTRTSNKNLIADAIKEKHFG